jgi:hypothetical protein
VLPRRCAQACVPLSAKVTAELSKSPWRARSQTNREQSCQVRCKDSSSVRANSTDGRSLTRHRMLYAPHIQKERQRTFVDQHEEYLFGFADACNKSCRQMDACDPVWLASNAQQKTEPPILTVRNPRQTMRALRRASLCNCRQSGYLPEATGTRRTQPRRVPLLNQYLYLVGERRFPPP